MAGRGRAEGELGDSGRGMAQDNGPRRLSERKVAHFKWVALWEGDISAKKRNANYRQRESFKQWEGKLR